MVREALTLRAAGRYSEAMNERNCRLTVTMLGSGTSAGVPMIGCRCAVCSSKDPKDQRSRPSIAVHYDDDAGVRRDILVDTSPELRLQSVRNRLDKIDAVVYTHAHADHIYGLDDVRRYNTINQAPLPLYASAETLRMLQTCFAYAFAPSEPRTQDALYRPDLAPVTIDGPFELFNRQWTPVNLEHGRFRVLGFRIGGFAYCTDCNAIPEESRAQLQGLDALIIDALRPRPHPTHLSFEQALAMIETLQPRRAYFTHLSHDMLHADIEKMLPPHVQVGYDGLKIEVGG
jgi:phosphoribosyl 1,2-cyclic phosphate phosphodiesterase